MNTYDDIYNELNNNILINGKEDNPKHVRTKYKDGSPATTISIINQQIKFDNDVVSPLLTTKRVGLKDPIKELLWIWQDMDNNVNNLEAKGCYVWSDWKNNEGNIGRAYGWQLANKYRKIDVDELFWSMLRNGEFKYSKEFKSETDEEWNEVIRLAQSSDFKVKLNQVDYLLYQLKKNPYSRRIKTTLWCVDDLDGMELEPCVYDTHWEMWDDKLNLTVNVRSNDMALGNPYNVYQYSVLHKVIAQVSGLLVGEICFNLDIPHIYDRHVDTLAEQIGGLTHEAPSVSINPEIKSFYDFTIDDVIVGEYNHNGTFKYEIAI